MVLWADMDLHIEPILPDYLIDPDSKASFKLAVEQLAQRALYDEVTDAARSWAEVNKKPYDRVAYVDALTPDEVSVLEARSTVRAMVTASKIQGLANRV